jgi:UDP-glucose 4-epimerase
MHKRVLVTGAHGYIGSHVARLAHESGYIVDGLDISSSDNNVRPYCDNLFYADIVNMGAYPGQDIEYDAVIHCAGLISVNESMDNPSRYYEVNTSGTLSIINKIKHKHFIFASTGGAFDPISPYAKSKILAETIIKDVCKDYTIFRFFNVAGNNGEFRQICTPSHIMHMAALAATGERDKMTIFGNDYDTKDGTCVRDYVHVVDLASAIIASIDNPANTEYECVGSGSGYSNLEVTNTMKQASEIDFTVEFGKRRAGDPGKLIVETMSKYVNIQHTLYEMCKSAFQMEATDKEKELSA